MIIWQNPICSVTEVSNSKHCRTIHSLNNLVDFLAAISSSRRNMVFHSILLIQRGSLCFVRVFLNIYKAPSPVNAMWAKGSKYVINLLNKTVAETLKWNILPLDILFDPHIICVTFPLTLEPLAGWQREEWLRWCRPALPPPCSSLSGGNLSSSVFLRMNKYRKNCRKLR